MRAGVGEEDEGHWCWRGWVGGEKEEEDGITVGRGAAVVQTGSVVGR